ncbi:flagellar basal body-associated protein FliL [Helicobacter salomonis]|uniref:flagellar basal body-associated protein FliL n=1 Tax=Helicobacter salomonis TaxID=56878 RepID=UPI000CF1B2DE|nr:flagellar basal body-associated protein FliL [Helicobacter salomonis]
MPEEAKAPKKSKAMLFVVMGAVLVMLILVGVIVILFMGKSAEPSSTPSASGGKQMRSAPMNESPDAGSVMVRSSDYLSLGPLYPLSSAFIVNLISQNGRRYLKTSISLELNDPKLLEEVKVKETAIKDTIIEILSSKSVEEISTLKGKNKLKEEIRSNINSFLIDGFVKNVFFTDFVIQ